MLKKLFLGVAMLLCVSVFAQEKAEGNVAKEPGQNTEQLSLAMRLINYGYDTQSALPLIQAVKIYQEMNVTEATDGLAPTTKQEADTRNGITKAEQPVRNEAQLLQDATTFAKGDKNLMALINECKTAKRSPTTGTIIRYFRCPSRSYQDWTVTCRGGERTTFLVSGDGDTDLDLYIYDQYGRLIGSDTSYGDDCCVAIDVYVTSTWTIRVKNLGYVYNDYCLMVY